MGDTRRLKLPVILAVIAVLAAGFGAPASASLNSLARSPLTAAPTAASSLAASVEALTSFSGTRLSWSLTPTGPRSYFGARYYGSKIARFTTVDPFLDQRAAIVDPQRWNRYSYGRNNPLRYVDPDGRDFLEKAEGAYNAFVSDYFLLPIIRGDSGSTDFFVGQAYGDRAAMAVGAAQAAAAVVGEAGGAGISFTGVGAAVGVPALAVSAGVAAHGAAVTTVAGTYLSKNAKEGGTTPRLKKDYNTLEGAQDQAESIRAQKRLQDKSGKRKIESTAKSDRAEQNQLDKIKSSADLPKDEH